MEGTFVALSEDCKLRGQITRARNSPRAVHAFKGVPYAKPPVGEQRFLPPQPSGLWSGTRDALEYGPICPQNVRAAEKTYFPYPVPENMSDDCLYLNVWTPDTDPAVKLPVMVWIYGGSFQTGFSNYYDGTAFAALKNVVFVSINYRVGAFGFLCTGDNVVKGNVGLLDQIEALRWVQRYIQQFGGDPDNVTVFGESAGAISISHQIASPLSRGSEGKSLFRRAICQSGASLHPGSLIPPYQARKFLHKRLPAMGCTSSDSKEILKFLQSLPCSEIVKHLYLFSFVIKDDIMFRDPHKAYRNGQCNPVDLMIGFNSHEGAQFVFDLARGHSVTSRKQAEDILTTIVKMKFYRGHPAADSVVRALREEYLDSVSDDCIELTKALVELHGDLLFYVPSIEKADFHSKLANTFMYHYEYRMSVSVYPEWVIADHGQEIPLMIGEPFLERFPDLWLEEDKKMSDTIMSLWSSFAKNGIPDFPGIPKWTQYTKTNQNYLNLTPGNTKEIKQSYKTPRVQFWRNRVASIVQNFSPVHTSKY